MVINRRRKTSRQRGSFTHGWGSKKKHRGAGHRGGKGMAGTGKRGDVKKPHIWKNKRYFGKYGIKNKSQTEKIIPLNLADIEKKINTWLDEKLITEDKGVFVIDSSKLKFNKVLGT